jgi:hypothetical protein
MTAVSERRLRELFRALRRLQRDELERAHQVAQLALFESPPQPRPRRRRRAPTRLGDWTFAAPKSIPSECQQREKKVEPSADAENPFD